MVAALLSTPAFSQQMMIETSNDNSIIELDALRKITFNGSDVNVQQTNGTIYSAPMSEINRIYFGNFTSIEELAPEKGFISYISADEIAINCPAGEIINVYNINGSHIFQVRQQEDNGSISIAQLPKGIYLLQTNGRTAKFIKQ